MVQQSAKKSDFFFASLTAGMQLRIRRANNRRGMVEGVGEERARRAHA